MMVRYAVENSVSTPEDLKKFTGYPEFETYEFSESRSSGSNFVFVRTDAKKTSANTKRKTAKKHESRSELSKGKRRKRN